MTTSNDHTAISIAMDGVWAGSGKLRDGMIEDCGAQFSDNNDESLTVYAEIESAIARGDNSLTVDLDGESRKLTWTITTP